MTEPLLIWCVLKKMMRVKRGEEWWRVSSTLHRHKCLTHKSLHYKCEEWRVFLKVASYASGVWTICELFRLFLPYLYKLCFKESVILPTEETKSGQQRKQKVANWGNEIRPTEETKSSQLRKCRKKWYLCTRNQIFEKMVFMLFLSGVWKIKTRLILLLAW